MLFMTGIARSGTTLLAHILNVNNKMAIAVHPFLAIYKNLRNSMLRNGERSIETSDYDSELPIQDYYFGKEAFDQFQIIQNGNLKLLINSDEVSDIIDGISCRSSHHAPDLIPFIEKLRKSENFEILISSAFDLIAEARNAYDCTWVGSVDVWNLEFYPAILKAFPNAKYIAILRDPRGIVASNQVFQGQDDYGHPLSYARHWRKYVALCIKYSYDPLFRNKFKVVFFEDLIREPKKVVKALCEFLDIPFSCKMIDARKFRSYPGATPWKGNSSFENTLNIEANKANRWQTTLKREMIKVVEFVCGPEMNLVGYKTQYKSERLKHDKCILKYLVSSNNAYYNWRSDNQDPLKDYSYELMRYNLLENRLNSNIANKLIKRCFLEYQLYELLMGSKKPPQDQFCISRFNRII